MVLKNNQGDLQKDQPCSRLLGMATTRTYGDGCGIAHALDLVGERWALLVVRELLLGPKRFTDLRSGLSNASPNVLAQRLRELERAGVVQRRRLRPPAGSRVYELTAWGRELEPIVLALGAWAVRSPSFPDDFPVGVDSVALALRSLFDPDAADGLSASFELRLDDDRFRLQIDAGTIEVDRGQVDDPDAIIETDVQTLRAVLWLGRKLGDAVRSGHLRIEGDRGAVTRLVGLFPRPEPDAPAAVA
jgi:DNA-binding HxlR family transcriptional regulator/putative sterol carrier protein